jgi:hypothetical protein
MWMVVEAAALTHRADDGKETKKRKNKKTQRREISIFLDVTISRVIT